MVLDRDRAQVELLWFAAALQRLGEPALDPPAVAGALRMEEQELRSS